MLDIAFGESRASPAVESLLASLSDLKLTGTLYVGYPLLNTIDGTLQVDALLTTLEHGVIAFDPTPRVFGVAESRKCRRSPVSASAISPTTSGFRTHRPPPRRPYSRARA